MFRFAALVVSAALIGSAQVAPVFARSDDGQSGANQLKKINHIVVIYQENHSFDNLFGNWEGVKGRASATAARTLQVSQAGVTFTCLKQNDVNLTSPPLAASCTDVTTATPFTSAFTNAPFSIDALIPPSATTCPAPGVFAANGVPNGTGQPGGCTRDIVHRFYQEQYQLNQGRMNRYTTGSDAVGLTQGYYDSTKLPLYAYLHQDDHPSYAIADAFFQGAFGGSFLNHQWLIAAATPTWPVAVNDGSTTSDLHSVADVNGMPNNYPLYVSPAGTTVKDNALTASCAPGPGRGPTPPGVLCGNYAVNTIQPAYQPYQPNTSPARRLPPQTAPTIGDRLSAAGVDWAWYAGGWSNANGDIGAPGWTNGTGTTCASAATNTAAVFPNCPDKLFQFHHQPFNYYAAYAPGTPARAAHLRDEAEFQSMANSSSRQCSLKPVSFVKPIGAENEHPGYAGENAGNSHLVSLLKSIEGSNCRKDTMVVVTYDEFGGQWDHVTPPGQGGVAGPHDAFGPGTRLPALVLAPHLQDSFVTDHAQHDTTSILATIEHRFKVAPLSARDGSVRDLSTVFRAQQEEGGDDQQHADS
ncbi:MAG: phosphoesterase [Candidatus Dormibacteraeota bacterium]|nr:phosphoesterase [Candidatus Dormibacteraeota bacterium]